MILTLSGSASCIPRDTKTSRLGRATDPVRYEAQAGPFRGERSGPQYSVKHLAKLPWRRQRTFVSAPIGDFETMHIERRYTTANQDAYAGIEFRSATSEIRNPDGSVVFRLEGMDVPSTWSQV